MLGGVIGWMRVNKLKLNPNRIEVLLVGSHLFWSDLMLTLAGVELPPGASVHSFSVLLDPYFLAEGQVAAVARRANHQLRHMLQL